jgi:hypothetical protein
MGRVFFLLKFLLRRCRLLSILYMVESLLYGIVVCNVQSTARQTIQNCQTSPVDTQPY